MDKAIFEQLMEGLRPFSIWTQSNGIVRDEQFGLLNIKENRFVTLSVDRVKLIDICQAVRSGKSVFYGKSSDYHTCIPKNMESEYRTLSVSFFDPPKKGGWITKIEFDCRVLYTTNRRTKETGPGLEDYARYISGHSEMPSLDGWDYAFRSGGCVYVFRTEFIFVWEK